MVVRVGIRELRANLSSYLARVKDGDELAITERGTVIARVVRPDSDDDHIARLIRQGTVTPAKQPEAADRPLEAPEAAARPVALGHRDRDATGRRVLRLYLDASALVDVAAEEPGAGSWTICGIRLPTSSRRG